MSSLFGGMSKSRDIESIITQLRESSLINENAAGQALYTTDISAMAEGIEKLMLEHYSGAMINRFDPMLQEDAEAAGQMFKNGLADAQSLSSASAMNESALMPNLVTLTASIATTMRVPYEAVLHRLFDTRTIDKQMVDIEEVIPTIKGPNDTKEEDMIDALSQRAKVPFVDRTELFVSELTEGVLMGSKDVPVLVGQKALFKVNRDLRVTHVDAELDGAAVPAENITFAKDHILVTARICQGLVQI